jgi:hypothetical protein
MEQNSQKPNFAKGIYLTKKQGKKGEFLELAIKEGDEYKKFVCFLSQKKDKFGNEQFTIYEKTKNDLPF